MRKFFGFEKLGTGYRQEIIGGVTTFISMAYIVVVNPGILSAAGIPKEAATTATILAAIFGTLIMAFYARRPFAIAPYMGENAFIAFTVCLGLKYTWQQALGAVFISGLVFILITAFRFRAWITSAVPNSLKHAFAVGIGFFVMFIGLNETGIVRVGIADAPVKIGLLSSAGPMLAIVGVILMSILLIRRVQGALLIGMLITATIAFAMGESSAPSQIFSAPPSLAPIFLKLDIAGALKLEFVPIIVVLFIMAFVDTMGTLVGLSARAGLLDEHGNLPEIEKPMMADAVATTAAALVGTTTTGAYIESATGIESGARTGFSALVTAFMFALCLFLTPIFVMIPPFAYGAALIVVGFMMLASAKQLRFDDYTELFPAVATIALMAFTYNIGFGMAAGFILYPLFKLLSGRSKETTVGLWVLCAISFLLFVFYPYGKV